MLNTMQMITRNQRLLSLEPGTPVVVHSKTQHLPGWDHSIHSKFSSTSFDVNLRVDWFKFSEDTPDKMIYLSDNPYWDFDVEKVADKPQPVPAVELECDGDCESEVGHMGVVRKVSVTDKFTDFGSFNYCQTAVDVDRFNGFSVVEGN